MPETKRSLKVFLCHAHDDKLKTRELYRYLRKRGIQPWLDAEDLVGGQDWRVEIPKAIKTSDAIIICLSKNSINKEGFVQAEITFALEKALEIPQGRIFIIPARFEDCEVPNNLERFHWVDLFEEDGFPKLMKSLRTRAGQLERATVQVPKPDESSPNLNSAPEEKIESVAALEKVEREMAEEAAREKAEKETAEKEQLEAEEQAKQKAAKEKVEREAAEKDAREKAEEEAVEKARLETEELAKQKVTKEKAEREVAEKVQHQAVRKAAKAKLLPNAVPFLGVIGILGIIIVLFWGGLLAIPHLLSLISTAKPSTTITPTVTLIPPTKIVVPTATMALPLTSVFVSDMLCVYRITQGENIFEILSRFNQAYSSDPKYYYCEVVDNLRCVKQELVQRPDILEGGLWIVIPNVIDGATCSAGAGSWVQNAIPR